MRVVGWRTRGEETAPRRRRRWLRRILLALAVGLLAIAASTIALFLIYPLPSNLNPYVPAPSTRIYDRHG
ncbi:MAG TPA: hypothetical protein VNL71_13465, partial [Chloroflexota bacterium]|nr:hypothetical protein [Chloroflexota bacterium]